MSVVAGPIRPAEVLRKSKPYLVPGKLKVTEWTFRVPLVHAEPAGEKIRLFARSAVKAESDGTGEEESESESASSSSSSSPWLYYLQGGPGFGCPPPQDAPYAKYFTGKGYAVMLMDQRGTGRSSTVTARTLRDRCGGDGGVAAQAAYLKHFRADSIVRDVEAIRLAVAESASDGKEKNDKAGSDGKTKPKDKISILGQSFGGFCATTYLSMLPDSLREVFMCGGLPPLGRDIDAVYARLVERSAARSRAFYDKFPDDGAVVADLAAWIDKQHQQQQQGKEEEKGGQGAAAGAATANNLKTASGGRLSVARLQGLGMLMGGRGGFTQMHNLFSRLNDDIATFGYWTRPSMDAFEGNDSFDDAIFYALLHEPIYVDGPGKAANWAAERMLRGSQFYGQDAHAAVAADRQLSFTAEMITRDTFLDHPELQGLLEVADKLAADKDWPHLYDEEVLAKNKVPTFCAVYHDDLYVDFDFSLATAAKIRGAKTFITNRSYHDGLRSDTTGVLDALLALRDDTLD